MFKVESKSSVYIKYNYKPIVQYANDTCEFRTSRPKERHVYDLVLCLCMQYVSMIFQISSSLGSKDGQTVTIGKFVINSIGQQKFKHYIERTFTCKVNGSLVSIVNFVKQM